MVVPKTIGFGQAGIDEFRVVPPVRFRMPVREGKVGRLAVVVAGDVVKVVAFHMHPKLRSADAEGMDFAKEKEIRRSGHVTRLLDHAILWIRFVMVGRTGPTDKGVHAIVFRAKKQPIPQLDWLLVAGTAKAAFGAHVWCDQRKLL